MLKVLGIICIIYIILVCISILIDYNNNRVKSMTILRKGLITQITYHPGFLDKLDYSNYFPKNQISSHKYPKNVVIVRVLVPFMNHNYYYDYKITDIELGTMYKVGGIVQVKVKIKDRKIVGRDKKFIL